MVFGISVVAVLVSCWEVIDSLFVQIAVPPVIVIVEVARRCLVGIIGQLGRDERPQWRGQKGTVVGRRLRHGDAGKLVADVADLVSVRQRIATQG